MQVDNTPQRVPELWFEDGNIVIQAGNSLFRLFRGILAGTSSVFRDMLSFPQPPEAELVEGYPLVRLPDAGSEVSVFLRAIFDSNFFKPFPAQTQYPIIQGCLRLSHKYEVDHLRLRALVHLSSRYRTSLAERDTCRFQYGFPSRNVSEIVSWNTDAMDLGQNIALIQLAREVEAPWILPHAFYDLCVEVQSDFADLLREGASLGSEDLARFLRGHHLQTLAGTTVILPSLSNPPYDIEDCKSAAKCRMTRLAALNALRREIQEYPTVPLSVWSEEDWRFVPEQPCSTCSSALEEALRDAWKNFWDGLPEMYGLPSWAELERMRVAALGVHWWRS
ncbi:hypothetical protein FB45DRAFT_1037078 [Roridomyces roridus]|uniref:BTB domain-containing protein n=1 Tax=Roridomyces roridus TaxID=1738132 RepID=A0AAD7B7D2_9AGAR|nr:hypothetical protein FB45DRAFT_1037078 [Roridomyces roridus]